MRIQNGAQTKTMVYGPAWPCPGGRRRRRQVAAGLQDVLPPGALTVIVNTGDDFEHWGLTICPDLDTVLYNLADIHNPETGLGAARDHLRRLRRMARIGGEDWFRIGDRDLAVHLRRNEWLRQGITLTEVTERLRRSFGIPSPVLPMSDEPVRTLVHTDEGDLPFQHYFVRRRCEPCLRPHLCRRGRAHLERRRHARPLHTADPIVICPSNPYLSPLTPSRVPACAALSERMRPDWPSRPLWRARRSRGLPPR